MEGPNAGWKPVPDGDRLKGMTLDTDEVAFVARAFDEGADAVVMKSYMPVAFLTAAAAAPKVDIPEGGRPVAVVDELDKNAVMDLVVILPGPKVQRRHDGQWVADDNWLHDSPVGEAAADRRARPRPGGDVAAQVDEQTAGTEWVDTDLDDYMNASAWARADEMALEMALVAAPIGKAMSKMTPGGRMPKDLQQYWLVRAGRGEDPVGHSWRVAALFPQPREVRRPEACAGHVHEPRPKRWAVTASRRTSGHDDGPLRGAGTQPDEPDTHPGRHRTDRSDPGAREGAGTDHRR